MSIWRITFPFQLTQLYIRIKYNEESQRLIGRLLMVKRGLHILTPFNVQVTPRQFPRNIKE